MRKTALVALVVATLATVSGLWSWAATVWQLQTKLSTAGGTLTVANSPTQTSVGSVVYTNFTSAAVPVTVAANPGYKISSLTRTGVAVALGNYTAHYSTTFLKSAGATQSLVAGFAARSFAVTASATGPGTITPASATVSSGGSAVFTATPSSTSNSFVAAATGGTVTDLSGNAVSFPYAGAVKIAVSNVTAPVSVAVTFASFRADAGAGQRVMIDSQVALKGNITGGGTPSWSQLSGPSVLLTGANTLNPVFVPTVTGSYVFQLAEIYAGQVVASSTTQVDVVNSLLDSMRSTCMGCHSADGVSPKPLAFTRWSTSNHKRVGVSCVTCHTNGAMPTPANTATVDVTTFKILAPQAGTVGAYYCQNCHTQPVGQDFDGSLHKTNGLTCTSCHVNGPHLPEVSLNVCGSCHFDANGNVPLHPVAITSVCVTCHNPHSTYAALTGALGAAHYNNITTGAYPASYVTSRAGCTNCHDGSYPNQVVRLQWDHSGHGNVNGVGFVKKDFKTLSGCVQCHTTTGFIAYSTGKVTAAWGTSDDKTKETISCIACHSDFSNGIVRSIAPVKPWADSNQVNHDYAISNICVGCHSGTNTGATIQNLVGSSDFTNLPFKAPHYRAAGASMQGRSGFRFPGQSYAAYSSNSHARVGMNNWANTGFDGPCVGCHMATTEKHLYKSLVLDATGTVTGVSSTVCVNCHQTSLPVAQINQDKMDFLNALEVLRAQLAAKGFVYNGVYPYFNNTNWGSGQDGANTMGAAYNYVLLKEELGSYAHNLQYAKKLVLDSIDYLDNGQFDDSVASFAVPNLVSSGAISQQVADSMNSFQTRKDLCNTCHGGSTGQANPISSNGHTSHLNGIYGPALFLGTTVNACQACHPANAALHMNGKVDLNLGAASGCLNCHAGQVPVWTSKARLDCTSCHAANPAVLPNGVAAPYKAKFGSTGHGQFAASNQCTVCHDPDASHISGSLGSFMRLRVPNDNNLCASCHNNATVGLGFRNMSTHVTKDGRGLSCRDCHDPHGTSNLSMIRSQINGVTITYTDPINGFIDPITNRGLCQVCHTLTNHYVAGVPETNHYTSGCLNCHSHNAAGGAFKPVGGACDSCHGYPPAPKNVKVAFGTPGTWANARYEDYSGGGGAHLVAGHVIPGAQAAEGWQNCAPCHSGGLTGSSPFHKMVTPLGLNAGNVTVLVDPKLRFSEGFAVYTGAKLVNQPGPNQTGSCFNVSCHMTKSARWSTER